MLAKVTYLEQRFIWNQNSLLCEHSKNAQDISEVSILWLVRTHELSTVWFYSSGFLSTQQYIFCQPHGILPSAFSVWYSGSFFADLWSSISMQLPHLCYSALQIPSAPAILNFKFYFCHSPRHQLSWVLLPSAVICIMIPDRKLTLLWRLSYVAPCLNDYILRLSSL